MEYSVNVTIQARRPITQDAMLCVAELGGVAVGKPGRRRLETTLTVSASDLPHAARDREDDMSAAASDISKRVRRRLWIRDAGGRYRAASHRQILDKALALLDARIRPGADLHTCRAVTDWLAVRLAGLEHEVFLVLFCDTRHRLIEAVEMFRGTVNAARIYPREVVKEALARNAAYIFCAHNHPSGTVEPSAEDQEITNVLREALRLVGVELSDHFVVAGGRVTPISLWRSSPEPRQRRRHAPRRKPRARV